MVSLHPGGSLDWKDSIVEVQCSQLTQLDQSSLFYHQDKKEILHNNGVYYYFVYTKVELRDLEEAPDSWEFAFLATSTPITVATDCRSRVWLH